MNTPEQQEASKEVVRQVLSMLHDHHQAALESVLKEDWGLAVVAEVLTASEVEQQVRQALGEYNAPTVAVQWLVENIVRGVDDNRCGMQSLKDHAVWWESRHKELAKTFAFMDFGDQASTEVLMVRRTAYNMCKQILRTMGS